MSRLFHMLRWDIVLQARNYIYIANLVSTAAIIAFVEILPFDPFPVSLASFFIFADPALIGVAFVGAIVMMEKASRALIALGVTPSPPWVYVCSKTITLAANGIASGFAVAWFALDGHFDWAIMILALVLSNIVAVLLGFAIVARSPSMNALMVRLIMITGVLFLPLLLHFKIVPEWAFWSIGLIPSYAMLLLFNGAADPSLLTTQEWVWSIAYQLVWIVFGWLWAMREFNKYTVSGGR